MDIFKRDDFTCQECEIKGGYLEAHHIKPFREIVRDIMQDSNGEDLFSVLMSSEELWNLDNDCTLCLKCHAKVDTHRNRFVGKYYNI